MKRLANILGFALAVAATSAACGAAATLTLGSHALSSGKASVSSCGVSSLSATRDVDNSGNVTGVGVAGIPAMLDLRGTTDRIGYELRSSRVAIADEIAGAADLARGKAEGVPAVVVRGLKLVGDGSAQEIVIEHELDLFS